MSERLHHLDALRALAMFLILPAHAIALLGLQRGSQGDVESSLAWLIHAFRLPLFFLVAGFFAALLLHTRGTAAVLRNRLIRIGVPLAVVVLSAGPLLVLLLNRVAAGEYRPAASGLAAFPQLRPSYGWFLWYLLLLYAIALPLRGALGRLPPSTNLLARRARRFVSHWAAPLALALPCVACLYLQSTWTAETPSDSFAPEPGLLAYYALFFACGWLLFAADGLREAIELRPRRYAAFAALTLPPALALYLKRGEALLAGSEALHLLALLLLSVATWSLVFGLLGLSRRLVSGANSRTRYWADASYWVYLSHFPVMAAIAIALLDVSIPGPLRATVLVVGTLALIYPAYGAVVRHTAIGHVLHGPRPRVKRHSSSRWRLPRPAKAAARRA